MQGQKSNHRIPLYTAEVRQAFGTLFRLARTTEWDLSFKWVSRIIIAAYESDVMGQKVNVLPLIRDFSRCEHILAEIVNEDALSLVRSYCEMVQGMIKSATPPKRKKWKIQLLEIARPELDTLEEEDIDSDN